MFTEDLDEAAEKVVKTAAIIRMAKEAKISIELTSWEWYETKDIYIIHIYFATFKHTLFYEFCISIWL